MGCPPATATATRTAAATAAGDLGPREIRRDPLWIGGHPHGYQLQQQQQQQQRKQKRRQQYSQCRIVGYGLGHEVPRTHGCVPIPRSQTHRRRTAKGIGERTAKSNVGASAVAPAAKLLAICSFQCGISTDLVGRPETAGCQDTPGGPQEIGGTREKDGETEACRYFSSPSTPLEAIGLGGGLGGQGSHCQRKQRRYQFQKVPANGRIDPVARNGPATHRKIHLHALAGGIVGKILCEFGYRATRTDVGTAGPDQLRFRHGEHEHEHEHEHELAHPIRGGTVSADDHQAIIDRSGSDRQQQCARIVGASRKVGLADPKHAQRHVPGSLVVSAESVARNPVDSHGTARCTSPHCYDGDIQWTLGRAGSPALYAGNGHSLVVGRSPAQTVCSCAQPGPGAGRCRQERILCRQGSDQGAGNLATRLRSRTHDRKGWREGWQRGPERRCSKRKQQGRFGGCGFQEEKRSQQIPHPPAEPNHHGGAHGDEGLGSANPLFESRHGRHCAGL
mmetsp:Transcript_2378/g.6369  ORF Transcript_2378/g.6369 Transcript_2378/m.6369 type:complete len:505 (+) Transcript_2378:861-2375(+)